MSDIEFNEEEFVDASFNENEVDETDLELIRIVRINPRLWDKSTKTYSNSIQKNLMWNSLASFLPIETTRAAAAKRFRSLWTMFSRHLKKVKQSQPRSGAGSDWSIHQPTWPLFDEMLFLTDVIKPRQTKSNTFNKPVSILKPRADGNNNCTATVLKRNSCQLQQSQSSCSKSSFYDKGQMSKQSANTAQLQSKITFSDSDDVDDPEHQYDSIADSNDESNAGSFVSTCKRPTKRPIPKTPPPDNFYQKKKMKNGTSMDNLDKLTRSLANLSEQIFSSPIQLSRHQEETKENTDPEVEGFLLLMKASLQRTRTQHRIPCVIEMLNILHNYEDKS